MKKRIFLAIFPSPKLKKKISIWKKSLARKLKQVRWTPEKNLHLTLIPPWYDEDYSKATEKLRSIKAEQFSVLLNKVTYGPNLKRPRLIWATGRAPKEFISLRNKLEQVLGYKEERSSSFVHLTLARFNPKDFLNFPTKSLRESVLWQDQVTSFAVVESQLLPQGSTYKILKRIKL